MKTGIGGAEPVLSVVIPVHNVGYWLEDALDSVLAQDIEGLEVIAVDDHSDDDSHAILQRYAQRDPRLRVIVPEGRGGGNARNEGIAAATGAYLAFADGDDLIPQGAYSAMVASLEKSGSDIAFGDFAKFDSDRLMWPTRNWKAFQAPHTAETLGDLPSLIRNRACWNKVFRRSFWDGVGAAFPTVPRANDIQAMTRTYVAAKAVDVVLNRVYLYRARPGDSSMSAKAAAGVGLTSYLGQELICARLVASYDDARLVREYTSLFLDSDGWVHLKRFAMQSAESGEPLPQEAIDSLAEIVSLLDAKHASGMKPRRLIPLLLAASGQPEVAVRLARICEPEPGFPGATDLELLTAWLDALEAATPLPTAAHAIVDAWSDEVAPRVFGNSELGADDAAEAMLDRIKALLPLASAAVRESNAGAQLTALTNVEPEERRMWLDLRASAFSALTFAERSGGSITFGGTLSPEHLDVPIALRLRNRGSSIATGTPLEISEIDGTLQWRSTVELSEIPPDRPGIISLEFFADTPTPIDGFVRATKASQVRSLGGGRVRVRALGRAEGFAIEVRRFAPLPVRGVRAIGRRVRKVAKHR